MLPPPPSLPQRPVATGEIVRPYGAQTRWSGRPVALAAAPDGRTLFAKDDHGLVVLDAATGGVRQTLASPGGSSLTGLAVAPSGEILLTDARSSLRVARLGPGGTYAWTPAIPLPKPKVGGEAYGCGLAVLPSGRVLVALSRGNEVAEVDLAARAVVRRLPTSPAPYALAVASGRVYVSCWGRSPAGRKAPASGTDVDVDGRGIAAGGTIDVFDLATGRPRARRPVGLQPSELLPLPDGRVVAALANDDALAVLGRDGSVRRVPLAVRAGDPFGSAPNALALGGGRLYVALGGSDAVAVLDPRSLRALGFVPAGWYPTALAFAGGRLFVANAKGDGAPLVVPGRGSTATRAFGSLSAYAPPTGRALAGATAETLRLSALPRAVLRRSGVPAVPVPERPGEPSVFEHVVYILRENRTYDQVLGDVKEGDGDPSLCLYGEGVTPNAHALAREFVLLDNAYCNGIISSDGHAWAIEGNATSYLERAFGGWTRSYPFGDDPLSASRTGYLWDWVLAGGRSFRNFGEFDYAAPIPASATFAEIYRDFAGSAGAGGGGKIAFAANIGVERLRRYSAPVPGWNLRIPDVLRADRFLKELRESERTGVFAAMNLLYLPQDHTSGLTPGMPTPRAHVADNDLALGRVIEGLSRSRFWPTTAVFVVEDDPQDGFDHVDGRRSPVLVVSPYTRRRAVVHDVYNGTSVLRTMFAILGLPPRTLAEARSPLMAACFSAPDAAPNLAPYAARPNRVPLDELNPPAARQTALLAPYARRRLPLDRPDAGDDARMNRILWRAAKGARPYPAWATGTGRGGAGAERRAAGGR